MSQEDDDKMLEWQKRMDRRKVESAEKDEDTAEQLRQAYLKRTGRSEMTP